MRIWVDPASKKSASLLFASAALRSVDVRVRPCVCAISANFSALRPTRIGSGITRSPFGKVTPPWSRMAQIERTRCWLYPIAPGDAVHDDAETVRGHFLGSLASITISTGD